MENVYIKEPLIISEINHESGINIRSVVFLTEAPQKIVSAANSYKLNGLLPIWSSSCSKILCDHYGPKWKSKLIPPQNLKLGGAFSDADFEDVKKQEVDEELSIIYTNIGVYPEDSIYDVKQKVTATMNIPYYRIHLNYKRCNCEFSQVSYELFVDNTKLDICINDIKSSDLSFPIKINQILHERKDNIKLTSCEHFEKLNGTIKHVRIVDLFNVTPSLESVDNPLLKKLISDRYSAELLFYGGIIKYWPHLSLGMYTTLISSEKSFRSKYPNLFTSKNKAIQQQEIITEFTNCMCKVKEINDNLCNVIINSASISIVPTWPIPVNIRNLFDSLRTSKDIPIIQGKIKVSNHDVSDNFVVANKDKVRLNLDIPVIVTKTCKQVTKRREVAAISIFLKRTMKHGTLSVLLFTPDRNKNDFSVVVTVTEKGTIIGFTKWQEDDAINFKTATKTIKNYIKDYVETIKSVGSVAFPVGGDLDTLNISDVNNLGCISLSTFWPHAISRETFSEIRAEFQQLEKAGLVNSKTVQAADSYSFEFMRGVKCRDRKNAAQKMSNYMNMSVEEMEENEFIWMQNVNISWKNIYSGRNIKLHHRISDVKIEMNDMYDFEEYKYIYKFIFIILNRYKHKAVKKVYENVVETRIAPVASDRLRRLQERDPLLYDLKRYDKNNEVYSIICQSGRQPFIYNEKEMKSLPSKTQSKLIKYWNFTEKKDAYYQCPDPAFPNFGFKVGQHPLGYCIPCCKVLQSNKSSKAYKYNKLCLENKTIENLDDTPGSHILSFGKTLGIDRLGYLPNNLEYELFMGVMKEPYTLHIVGVHQTTEACQNVGFAYAVANALKKPEETVQDVFTKLIISINDFGEKYRILGNGAANKFLTCKDLVSFLNRLLIQNDVNFDVINSCEMKLILGDMVRYIYGVEIVTFIVTDADIELNISNDAITGICNSACRSRLNILLLLEYDDKTYPIYAFDVVSYNKAAEEFKHKFVRKLFQCNYDNVSYYPGDNVIESIVDILRFDQPHNVLDYNLITMICEEFNYTIVERYVNKHNYYYYVKIKVETGDFLYIPIELSSFQIGSSKLVFTYVKPDNKYDVLESFLKKIIKFINIKKETSILDINGKCIGFKFKHLCFYHEPKQERHTDSVVTFQYNTQEIDKEIMKYSPKCVLSKEAILFDIKIKSYILFLSEFYYFIKNEKNTELRGKLTKFLNSIDVKNQKNLLIVKQKIFELFSEFPEDVNLIRCIINNKPNVKSIICTIDSVKLESDRVTLQKLCKCPNITKDLDDIMKTKTKIVEEYPEKYSLINMYSDCSNNSHTLCDKNKLLIRQEEYDRNLSILAADIKNPYKTNLFNQLNKQVFNNLVFIEYPFECVQIQYGWS